MTAETLETLETPRSLLDFPAGLVGLPDAHHFEVGAFGDEGLVELVSLDEPGLGFVAAPAEYVRPGMTDELRLHGLASPAEELLVLLSLHGGAVTANLAGPLAVDPADRLARQLVLEDPRFPVRAPVAPTR